MLEAQVHRPHAALRPFALEPRQGRLEQRGRQPGVVLRFEEPHEAVVRAVKAVVAIVDDGRDATDHLAVTTGQEEGRPGLFEEGVLLRVEELAALGDDRRHEVLVACIVIELKADELVLRPATGHLFHRHVRSPHRKPGHGHLR